MKRAMYACIALMLFHFTAFSQKIDTLNIRNQVYALTPANAGSALHKVVEEDQKYRGANSNDSLDLAHLIWLCYFMDRFGYPDKKIYGNDSFAASVVWIHNHRLLRIASFPLIFNGFLSGEIRENDLRDYYLRTVYNYRFEDEAYLHMPLNDLFKVLELNTQRSVSVAQLAALADEIQAFKALPKKRIGIWESEPTTKTYDKDGKSVTVSFEGERAEIYQTSDGRYFIVMSSSYGKKEPQELARSDDNSYRYKNLKTDAYITVKDNTMQVIRGGKTERSYKTGG